MGSTTTNEVPTADLVSADSAAVAAQDSGAGDQAVWDARMAELDAIYNRRVKLADIALTAAQMSAEVWGTESAKGSGILKTAAKDRAEAVEFAIKARAEAIAKFAADNGFYNMVPADQLEAVCARSIVKQIRPVVVMLENLDREGIATLDLGNGLVRNVLDWLEDLRSIGAPIVSSETVETSETVEETATVEA